MTKETKDRIEYYKNAVPQIRAKLAGAAMMFLIAIITVVSATYAWITLSVSPEVTGVDTTVTANGSLEIALANGTGSAPGRSAAGDSVGAGTPITNANITWGNLVNLSDPSYGLENVTLRPAALRGKTGLLNSPLYGVGYGADGRVSSMVTDDDFAYTYYDSSAGGSGRFMVDTQSNHLGVRAISTVKYENLSGNETLVELLQATNQELMTAKSRYAQMMDDKNEPGKSYITSLQGLMQVYAQNKIDGKPWGTIDVTAYIHNLYVMMTYFDENVMETSGKSYVQMTNMLELMVGSGNASSGYTVEKLVTDYQKNALPDYIKNNLKNFGSFASDYIQLQGYLKTSERGDYSDLSAAEKKKSLAYWDYYATQKAGTVYWTDILDVVNWICNIDTATLDGYPLPQISNLSVAVKILGHRNHQAVINKGAIWRAEQRLNEHMNTNISVTIDPSSKIKMSKQTLNAVLTTSASGPYDMDQDLEQVKSQNDGTFRGTDATAEDTYALAVDLWLRTNAGSESTEVKVEQGEDGAEIVTTPEQAYLILEGSVITGTEEGQATTEDADGVERQVYTAAFTVEGNQVSREVFEKYGYYYFINDETKEEVNFEEYLKTEYGIDASDITYTPKMSQRQVVIGYEGVNRIWNSEQMAGYVEGGTSTTQGSGSCYVFYADTPADQSRFLELLESMKVVFIDGEGRQIGAATMDTENYFAENGKVTVPLALDKTQAINLGDDENGNTIYGLMSMKKNAATRVTALVYLDGTKLTNQMVLASGDIQGNLNIQFGTYIASKTSTTTKDDEGNDSTDERYDPGKKNESITDDSLMDDKIEVSATVDNTEFTYDKEHPATTTLKVKVEGVEPSTVEARFIRAISSTQGVQQERMNLSGDKSDWNGTVTFENPGNYVLRTVWVDGVEYDLKEAVSVTVKGYAVNSLTCDAIPAGSNNRATIMTAESSFSTAMTLGFNTSEQLPSKVNGVFMDEEGRQVNVPFSLKAGVWSGTAVFNSSGTYTMKYVELDNETYELDEKLQITLELLMGLRANVTLSASPETLQKLQAINPSAMPTSFVLDPGKLDIAGGQDVTLNVAVKIYDNSGNEIKGLSDVNLYYGRAGSSIRGLDAKLNWNSESYIGAFLVTEAGNYSFSRVTVKNGETVSTISTSTGAPNIQAIPPDDASYYADYTEEYQYKINKDAVMTIGVAYSSAARIEATLRKGDYTEVVPGTLGLDVPNQDGKSVNKWNFTIPKINDTVAQEGEWSLDSITMYGVYYNKQYYGDTGVTVDLTDENIHTKVVNFVHVVLSGTSEKFNGYFMDDHKVSDMMVSIADYEGQPIQGYDVTNVTVSYLLEAGEVNFNTYGYTGTDLASVNVTGTGTLKSGSDTEYAISTLNFQNAGPYKRCSISYTMNGTAITAGNEEGVKVEYADGGKPSTQCPQFDVKWTAPTVKITKIDPDPSEIYDVNVGGMSGNARGHATHTYVSEDGYYAYMTGKMGGNFLGLTSITWPKLTLKLEGAGSNYNNADFSIPKAKGDNARVYSFTPHKDTITNQIGETNGNRQYTEYQKIETIDMKYGTNIYNVKLSHEIEIYEVEIPIGRISYELPEASATKLESREMVHKSDSIVLETIPNYTETVTEDGVAGNRITIESQKEVVYYKPRLGFQYKTVTTTTYKTPYTGQTYLITYKVSGWKIERENLKDGTKTTLSKIYKPGEKLDVDFGYDYVIKPVTEEVSKVSIGTKTSYHYEKEVTASENFEYAVFNPGGSGYADKKAVNAYIDSIKGTYDLGWKDN